MKRGFLLSGPSSSSSSSSSSPSTAAKGKGKASTSSGAGRSAAAAAASPQARSARKISEEELQRERDAVVMSRLSIDQAIEYESLREDIATDRQAMRNYEIREERNKQAMGYLQRPEADPKVWYCAGDFFIRLPKDKAEKLVKQDQDHTACEMDAAKERIQKNTQEIDRLSK